MEELALAKETDDGLASTRLAKLRADLADKRGAAGAR